MWPSLSLFPLLLCLYIYIFLSSQQAFGLGALEEEDAEDNVYGEESMTSYDVTLMKDGDVEMERNFGWTGGVEGHSINFQFHYCFILIVNATDSWSLNSFKKTTKPTNKTKVS